MTIEEAIQDLKQYIDVSVGQRIDGLATKEDVQRLDKRIGAIEQTMATKADVKARESHIDEKLDTVLNAVGERFNAAEEAIEAQQYKALEHRVRVIEELATSLNLKLT